jgi:methyltransferase (TIGR00027 family)
MNTGQASRTALGVAVRRAAHQLVDHPPVMDDPIAVQLLGNHYPRHMERAMHSVARDFRCSMAVRSRFAEDRLRDAVSAGVNQYVVLGAGLDTFALRNPFPALRVFEVDLPATQKWKRQMLKRAGLIEPATMRFVPLDFEQQTLAAGLVGAGLATERPAWFSCLGVVPYLTLDGLRATLDTIAQMPAGSGVVFDYAVPREMLDAAGRTAFDRLAQRVAAAGEPLRLFFSPEELAEELRRAGFQRYEQLDFNDLNQLYFRDRADGLKLSPLGLGRVATAWVGERQGTGNRE